jgi:phosphopantothenate synthetase
MNTIQIKPVSRTADVVNISIVIDNNSAKANVILHSKNIMESHNVVIEGAEYDAWGSDDNYIYDLILSKLGFERA